MALTKKDRQELERILYHITRAERFIMRDDVAGIALERKGPPIGSTYVIQNPACSDVHAVAVVDKHIGSDLTGLYHAKRNLMALLEGKEPRRKAAIVEKEEKGAS